MWLLTEEVLSFHAIRNNQCPQVNAVYDTHGYFSRCRIKQDPRPAFPIFEYTLAGVCFPSAHKSSGPYSCSLCHNFSDILARAATTAGARCPSSATMASNLKSDTSAMHVYPFMMLYYSESFATAKPGQAHEAVRRRPGFQVFGCCDIVSTRLVPGQ